MYNREPIRKEEQIFIISVVTSTNKGRVIFFLCVPKRDKELQWKLEKIVRSLAREEGPSQSVSSWLSSASQLFFKNTSAPILKDNEIACVMWGQHYQRCTKSKNPTGAVD